MRTGKKVGRRSAYSTGEIPMHDQLAEGRVETGGRRRWRGKRA